MKERNIKLASLESPTKDDFKIFTETQERKTCISKKLNCNYLYIYLNIYQITCYSLVILVEGFMLMKLNCIQILCQWGQILGFMN